MAHSYLDLDVGEFLDAVARREPAPGGGSVAAMTVAMAAGLVAMAARFSAEPGADPGVAQEADEGRRRAAGLAEQDAVAYQQVLEAYSSSRDDPTRRERIRQALEAACQVPLEIAGIGVEVAAQASRLAEQGNPTTRGDAETARLLAEAAVRASARLVEINVEAGAGDPDLTRRAQRHIDDLADPPG